MSTIKNDKSTHAQFSDRYGFVWPMNKATKALLAHKGYSYVENTYKQYFGRIAPPN